MAALGFVFTYFAFNGDWKLAGMPLFLWLDTKTESILLQFSHIFLHTKHRIFKTELIFQQRRKNLEQETCFVTWLKNKVSTNFVAFV